MTSHRFGIGEGVTYSEKRFPTGIWIAELTVVEQLSRDGEPEYRLRVQDGATEYVLAEHELSPSSDKRNDNFSWRPDRARPPAFLASEVEGSRVIRKLSLVPVPERSL